MIMPFNFFNRLKMLVVETPAFTFLPFEKIELPKYHKKNLKLTKYKTSEGHYFLYFFIPKHSCTFTQLLIEYLNL